MPSGKLPVDADQANAKPSDYLNLGQVRPYGRLYAAATVSNPANTITGQMFEQLGLIV